ncbi:MAG TPA: DUF5719 family protein [Nocardioides sp.]|nr:DUF5719 family protein [Nocardioides sp.]
MTEAPRPGRRATLSRERRIDVLVLLAILLPAIVAVSVAVIGAEDDSLPGPQPPTTATLTSATVICPGGTSGRSGVRVSRAPEVRGGELAVATAPARGSVTKATAPVTVAPRTSVVLPASAGAVVVEGRGDAAPGIVAGRDDRLAVPECRAPSYDEWLVGIGASARHATTVELVNPDDGDAVVDLALIGEDGPVEEPALRGIEVPAHGVRLVDLAKEAPRAEVTSAHLTVVRGRVTATARTTWDPLGRGRVTTDFLPADPEPATSSLLLGLPDRPVAPTLHLANPGDDEVRVTTRLVTEQAVFTPTQGRQVAVPPHSTLSVDLSKVLSGDAAKGTLGLLVEATGPVASSLMTFDRDDLVLLAPAPEVRDPAALVVPTGDKTLVLGGAERAGVVHVTSYDASGKVLADDPVEVGADRAVPLTLPARAVAVAVEARNTPIRAVVTVPASGRQPGLATLRLLPAELRARIPAVAPQ